MSPYIHSSRHASTRARRPSLMSLIITCLVIPLTVANCGQIGGGAGLNQNEQSSGNREGGVDLSWDQIAIDPTGSYFISGRHGQVIYGDIKTGESKILEGISNMTRLVFGADHMIYCDAYHQSESVLAAYDLRSEEVIWAIPEAELADEDGQVESYANATLDLSRDQSRLIVAGVKRFRVLDVRDGHVMFDTTFDKTIVDVDVHPTEDRVLVTLDHEWVDEVPQTQLISMSWEHLQASPSAEDDQARSAESTLGVTTLSRAEINAELTSTQRPLTKATHQIAQLEPSRELEPALPVLNRPKTVKIIIPNCSSELTLTPNGKRAFLAPTRCRKDPVSVIDLVEERFVRNLPGFGPVAMSPSGETAIAFINMNNVEEHLFDDPSQIPSKEDGIYHLMLINTSDLSFKTLPLGDRLPRYALTPNGQMLLIDDAQVFGREDAQVRILDIDTLTLQPVVGPSVRLLHYVLTSDSSRALLIDEHLYELSIEERRVEKLDINIEPSRLNITPDDQQLIVRSKSNKLWVYDLVARKMSHQIHLPYSHYDEQYTEYQAEFEEYFN